MLILIAELGQDINIYNTKFSYDCVSIPYYKIQQMASKEAYDLKGTQLNCNFAVNKLPSNVCTLFYIPR